ncbi:MAG TPA: spore coat protein CotJB [Lachnospiraceae bacterium]|nr:spore coat protein CotJB [Lachnospiraceae bacterium]
MMNQNPRRQELLDRINAVSFAIDDVILYLDTHPCDREAIAYYQECSRLRNEALKEYAEKFGPLTIDYAMRDASDNWNWTETPWPWMEGGC